jgi:hypothetical protein
VVNTAPALGPSLEWATPQPPSSMAIWLWAVCLGLLWAQTVAGQAINTTWTAPDLTSSRSPRFTYLGCFQDSNSSYTIRRMARRLAVWPDMNPAQCAARADAFGYTLFGLTPYEDEPRFGWSCWGGFDEAAARALGRTSPCNGWCPATTCGVHWKLALWRLENRTYDQGIGGWQWAGAAAASSAAWHHPRGGRLCVPCSSR